MTGEYLKHEQEIPEGVAFRFSQKKKNQSITLDGVVRELHELGMDDALYGIILKVPAEYPDRKIPLVDIMEPEDACIALALACGYTVYDQQGQKRTGLSCFPKRVFATGEED